MQAIKTLSQIFAHHYVAFVVEGHDAAFASQADAFLYAEHVGAAFNTVKALYRF